MVVPTFPATTIIRCEGVTKDAFYWKEKMYELQATGKPGD